MSEPRHECVELATLWKDSHGDCFNHHLELRERVGKLVRSIHSMLTQVNRESCEAYLQSIGVEPILDPENDDISEADLKVVQQKLSEAGLTLSVKRFRQIYTPAQTLGECFFLERRGQRQAAELMEWSAEIAAHLGYPQRIPHGIAKRVGNIEPSALDVEIAGDALDILCSIDGRPFDRNAALELSKQLTELTHPDSNLYKNGIGLLRAYEWWWDQNRRLINWLVFTDRSLKTDFDVVEASLHCHPKLLARYRLLKARSRPVFFESLRDHDDLWNTDFENRTPDYMKRGFKYLQEVLNKKEFTHLEITVTANSVVMKTI